MTMIIIGSSDDEKGKGLFVFSLLSPTFTCIDTTIGTHDGNFFWIPSPIDLYDFCL